MSAVYCQDCDKELSEEKGELAHGCLHCHGSPQPEKLFWLRKEISKLRQRLKEAEGVIDFYGNTQKMPDYLHEWDGMGIGYGHFDDFETMDNGIRYSGKRAREYQEKYKDNEEVREV